MKDDTDLHQLLNRPPVPDDLESKIRANWHEQKSKQLSNKPAKYLLVAASIFAMVVGTVFLNSYFTAPNLISVAINDINNDAKQHIGIALPIESVVQEANIHLPPDSMPIEMSKLCTLNGNQTMHLKVAGAKQGEVHLFIKKGDFEASIWKSEQSATATMPWKLIKPRDDLSVLVLYTKDMNPANVDVLIQTMFYV